MWGRMARGWSMAKASFAVLRQYPRLLILPLIATIAGLGILGLIGLSIFVAPKDLVNFLFGYWVLGREAGSGWVSHIGALAALGALGFAVMFVLSAIGIFFNVALLHCAMRCHLGEEPSLRDGMAAARSRLPQILGWAFVATGIGLVLGAIQQILSEKLGFLGSLFGGLLQFSWAVATYFVLPVLATERVGPITALRQSAAIVRSKWGEAGAGEARMTLVGFLMFLPALFTFIAALFVFLGWPAAAYEPLAIPLAVTGVLLTIPMLVVMPTLTLIFQAGVYMYATSGQVPASLDRDLVDGAFRRKA